MAAKKNPLFDTATTLGKLMLFLGVSSICGVLVAGLMVPAVALTGTTATSSINFFDDLPAEMSVGTPAQSSKILAADGSVLATFYNQNRTEVKLAAISPFMKNAVIAVEDARYYEHGGIDTKGLVRAVTSMLGGGDRQGASTITQQYVNNVIIQTYAANGEDKKIKLGSDKTIGDKVREIKLAIAMEKKYSKDEILQGYLNWVYFSNNNYGIESAANFYFGVHAKDLALPQAALLAGVVNSPSYYDPVAHPDNALSRRNMVLDRMLAQKMIDQKQYDAAVKSKVALKISPNKNGCTTAVRGEYFCEYVTNLIVNDPAYGKTKADREKLLYQGGLTIKTTLEPKLQDTAQAAFNAYAPLTNNPDKVGQSLVTVQPKTGKILAMAQNTKLNAPKGQWSTEYNFNVDKFDTKGQSLGGSGGFDVGSTIKPFTFAEWLNSGHKINEIVDASVRKYPLGFPWRNSCGVSSGIYDNNYPGSSDLQNAENNFYQRLTAREGLYNSLNTATFATAAQLDLCNIQKMMTAAGIHLGADPNKPYDLANVSSLLGSGEVAPLTMATAFATFASGGVHCDPIALVSVTNAKGNKFPVPGANCKQTIRPEVAAGVVSVLQEVLVRGSGYQIGLIYPAGAKTGTTNDSQQTWTTGFTKGLVTSSWVGSPDNKNRSNNGLLIANQRIPYVDGATYAGHAWQSYMNQVAGGFDTSGFDAPPASMLNPIVVTPPPSKDTGKDAGTKDAPKNKDKKD
ncbi:transglycosylase domain-containing protein [Specibacter sp. RAF43]|uniref:transglycosylase domain-containing protein n=1 Tax=Specibacter sp. RAF43 TaxID=3233057 RepID=UPI003F9A30A1